MFGVNSQMQLLKAWDTCEHGKAIVNTSTGKRVEKWMGEKPGLSPAITRMMVDNPGLFTLEELASGEWEHEQSLV